MAVCQPSPRGLPASSVVRHNYACPLRWADLDAQGHVNNVVFVDYLQEARVDLSSRGPQELAMSVLGTQRLEYVAPLMFSFDPVLVDVWVSAVSTSSYTLGYEVYRPGADGGRIVHLRASSTLVAFDFGTQRTRSLTEEERAFLASYAEEVEVPAEPFGAARHEELGHYAVKVRFSDIDLAGIVNNVKYLEYFQEGRVQVLDRVAQAAGIGVWPPVVLARQDVQYVSPIRLRPEPYDAWTWIERLGNSSMVLGAEIRDGDTVHARGRFVAVFFDLATNRSAQPPAELREALARLAG
jgi:acyl-CoA thioester hydrolase